MNQPLSERRFRDLLEIFEQLRNLNDQLFTLIDAKIAAMKSADTSALTAFAEKERVLTERLREREGLRAQFMDAVGIELGLPQRAGRTLTMSQLAARLDGPQSAKLIVVADRLRSAVGQVLQANRVAGAVSREILNHLKWIFAAVRPREEKPELYSGAGVPLGRSGAAMLEVVG